MAQEQKQEQKVKALFTWTAAGAEAAMEIAGVYRQAGMQVFLYGEAAEADLIALGEADGMTHVLHFVDAENIRLVSLTDEMGGFTVDIQKKDLVLPR